MAIPNPRHRSVDPVVRLESHILGVEIAAMTIGIDALVAIDGKLPAGLVVEPLPHHVYGDDVLPVSNAQSRGPRFAEHGAACLPAQVHVTVLATNLAGLCQRRPGFRGLIVE